MRTITAIAILMILSGCNEPDELKVSDVTDITIYNYAFNGTLIIGEHDAYLGLGGARTIIIEEGLHKLTLISDVRTHSPNGYRGLVMKVFVAPGHNEYVISTPAEERVFYIIDE